MTFTTYEFRLLKHLPEVEVGSSWADGHDKFTVEAINGLDCTIISDFLAPENMLLTKVQVLLDPEYTLSVKVSLDDGGEETGKFNSLADAHLWALNTLFWKSRDQHTAFSVELERTWASR